MDLEEVKGVAWNARLKLTDEEMQEFAKDLEDVLSYFSILDKAPDSGKHDFNPVPISNVLREDEVSRDIDAEKLRDSMDTYQDMVRGPRLT
jgi:aspartyl-tRNA(Asn)/glutamyl-tRNA(Gln) amidotransferase subunit C